MSDPLDFFDVLKHCLELLWEDAMARSLNYVAEVEPWSVYQIEDGSTVRARLILSSVEFHGIAEDGMPTYDLHFQQIVDVTLGEHLHDTLIGKKG